MKMIVVLRANLKLRPYVAALIPSTIPYINQWFYYSIVFHFYTILLLPNLQYILIKTIVSAILY